MMSAVVSADGPSKWLVSRHGIPNKTTINNYSVSRSLAIPRWAVTSPCRRKMSGLVHANTRQHGPTRSRRTSNRHVGLCVHTETAIVSAVSVGVVPETHEPTWRTYICPDVTGRRVGSCWPVCLGTRHDTARQLSAASVSFVCVRGALQWSWKHLSV